LNPGLHKKPKDGTGAGAPENSHAHPPADNIDEDFTTDMNENAEALKIKNKTAKSNCH